MLSDNSPTIWSCMTHVLVVHMNQYLTTLRYISAYFTINSFRIYLSRVINKFKKITIWITELSTIKVDNPTILVQLFDRYVYAIIRLGGSLFLWGTISIALPVSQNINWSLGTLVSKINIKTHHYELTVTQETTRIWNLIG